MKPQLPARQAGLSMVVILLIVLIVVVVALGTVMALYLGGVIGGKSEPAPQALAEGEEAPPPAPTGPPLYLPLEPPLVVNFDRNGRIGFLQASIQIMTRAADVQEGMQKHMPVIRNNLLLLLSSKTYADVASREGKEALRQEALAEVNAVLEQQGVAGRAEDLYFTGFVMQ